MSQPMLSLKSDTPSGEAPKTTPHLLPCRVHHTGSVEPAQSFWEPRVSNDGTNTAYFRGRKLQGKTAKLPEGHRGVVAVTSPPKAPSRHPDGAEVIDLEAGMPQGALQIQAEFDEMVIWSHEAAVDAAADPYLRGVEEWLTLAEKIHSYPAPASKK